LVCNGLKGVEFGRAEAVSLLVVKRAVTACSRSSRSVLFRGPSNTSFREGRVVRRMHGGAAVLVGSGSRVVLDVTRLVEGVVRGVLTWLSHLAQQYLQVPSRPTWVHPRRSAALAVTQVVAYAPCLFKPARQNVSAFKGKNRHYPSTQALLSLYTTRLTPCSVHPLSLRCLRTHARPPLLTQM